MHYLVTDLCTPLHPPTVPARPFPCQVVAHYDLIEEFKIRVPDMQLAAYQTLDSDYTSLRDAMWSGASLSMLFLC